MEPLASNPAPPPYRSSQFGNFSIGYSEAKRLTAAWVPMPTMTARPLTVSAVLIRYTRTGGCESGCVVNVADAQALSNNIFSPKQQFLVLRRFDLMDCRLG